ncbi:lysophospholipid acyltransferase family protein [Luteolibacter algae]|uniref:Lysophospholipid acyltransferase family protein n=2 Tax=Luteolibacter algae TaxID=454151 RepID=A0ABW5D344_9BACT
MRQLPAETVFCVGEAMGKMIWPFMTRRQQTISRNLRVALAGEELSLDEIAEFARNSFIRTTANLVSSAITSKASKEGLGDLLTVENPEVMDAAVAKGRGVVLLLAHMGNWELLTRMHRTFPEGTKSGAFYRPLNNPILNERVLKEREADGTRLFSKRDSLHQVGGFLRENGVIGILADQRVGMQGENVSFFGRITKASPLPSLLVRRCKSEVLALSLKTVAPGKWSARYHKVEKPYNSSNCMRALEEAMKVSPLDVFWLQERWKLYISGEVPLREWLSKEELRGEKPHRAVIWTKPGEETRSLPEGFQHGDVHYERVSGKSVDELGDLDQSKLLPIDFVLTFSADDELWKRGKELGIPVYSLENASE